MVTTTSFLYISAFRNQVAAWLLLFILMSSFFAPSVSFAQQPTAQVKAWTGSVLVSGQTVTVGMVLHAGDTLQTGSQALVIIELSDGSTLHLGANTQVTLADLAQTATDGRVSLIKLFAGRVRALLSANHQKPGSTFTIETPNAQIGVKFSQPDVEVSYDPAKQETVGIAHTVELIAINLLTNERIVVPVGSTVIIVGALVKIAAGTAASMLAREAAQAATGTTGAATASGIGTGTVVVVGAGVATVAGGVAAIAANSSKDEDSGSGMVGDGVYQWKFEENTTTIGCIRPSPGGPGNGTYTTFPSLQVERKGNTLTGSGIDMNGMFSTLTGTISGTNVEFRRYGPGWTPGYTIDWNYFGAIRGNRITGTFSGGGDPNDSNSQGCSSSGTFTVTIQ